MFAWYVFPLRSALNLWSVLNLWSAFPLRYVEYDICVACANFLSLGDKGLELYIYINKYVRMYWDHSPINYDSPIPDHVLPTLQKGT